MTVRAYDRYRTNGDLIAAAAELGHLRKEWSVLDLTYGEGTFWRRWQPDYLEGNCYEHGQLVFWKDGAWETYSMDRADLDFRDLHRLSPTYDVTVLDGPYGLRGTINDTNGGYGLDGGYLSVEDRHKLLEEGLREAARIARRRVLFKCQDQVCSQRIWWQTRIFADAGEAHGLRLVERLDMAGGRAQPARKRWVCLVCGKGEPPGPSAGPKHCCRAAKVRTDRATGERVPWLEQRTSPQEHAYYRPSSLLIFEKRGGTNGTSEQG